MQDKEEKFGQREFRLDEFLIRPPVREKGFRFEEKFPPDLDKFNKNKEIIKKINFEELLDREIDFRDKNEKFDIPNKWDLDRILEFREFIRVPQVELFPSDLTGLARILTREGQTDNEGRLRYLLTSGLAVEVITGTKRAHHDMDLVIFDESQGWWLKYATDNVTPKKYWADMKFDPGYLEQTAWRAQFMTDDWILHEIRTVHPAIILIQKLSNAWGRPPRERDINDVRQLLKFWRESLDSDPSWHSVIQAAIQALPANERARTNQRLRSELAH